MQNQNGPKKRPKLSSSGSREQQRRADPQNRPKRTEDTGAGQRISSSAGRNPKQPPIKKQRKPKVKKHWFSAIAMVLATVVGCIFLAFFILRSANDLLGLNQPENDFVVNIPENADVKTVSDILAKTGIIDTPLTFRAYIAYKEKEPVINPGEYTFNSNMAYDEIIISLKTVSIAEKTTIITFVEHLSLEEIADLLQEKEVIKDSQDFLDYLDSVELDYDFLLDLPKDNNRYHKYEGYFFPDTYEFYIGEKYDDIIAKFMNNFSRKIKDEMYSQMDRRGMTLDETIILASVIQKEASIRKDMVRVSSVFHNRLKDPANFPKLQSDVTLLYVEEFIKPHMNDTPNQEMYDAYNTYVRDGLPVGPICNPGAEAIHAALNYVDTDYYYFVTDVNQDFYYSSTLAEHQEKILLAAQADESGSGVVHGIRTRDPDESAG